MGDACISASFVLKHLGSEPFTTDSQVLHRDVCFRCARPFALSQEQLHSWYFFPTQTHNVREIGAGIKRHRVINEGRFDRVFGSGVADRDQGHCNTDSGSREAASVGSYPPSTFRDCRGQGSCTSSSCLRHRQSEEVTVCSDPWPRHYEFDVEPYTSCGSEDDSDDDRTQRKTFWRSARPARRSERSANRDRKTPKKTDSHSLRKNGSESHGSDRTGQKNGSRSKKRVSARTKPKSDSRQNPDSRLPSAISKCGRWLLKEGDGDTQGWLVVDPRENRHPHASGGQSSSWLTASCSSDLSQWSGYRSNESINYGLPPPWEVSPVRIMLERCFKKCRDFFKELFACGRVHRRCS